MTAKILIPRSIYLQMQAYVEQEAPLEACGILGGQECLVSHIIPVMNILKSPTQFRMDPQAQIEAFNQLLNKGCELIAIYHSHPQGKGQPSKEDIDQAYYPEAAHIIWFTRAHRWSCHAYTIKNRVVNQLEVHILEAE